MTVGQRSKTTVSGGEEGKKWLSYQSIRGTLAKTSGAIIFYQLKNVAFWMLREACDGARGKHSPQETISLTRFRWHSKFIVAWQEEDYSYTLRMFKEEAAWRAGEEGYTEQMSGKSLNAESGKTRVFRYRTAEYGPVCSVYGEDVSTLFFLLSTGRVSQADINYIQELYFCLLWVCVCMCVHTGVCVYTFVHMYVEQYILNQWLYMIFNYKYYVFNRVRLKHGIRGWAKQV